MTSRGLVDGYRYQGADSNFAECSSSNATHPLPTMLRRGDGVSPAHAEAREAALRRALRSAAQRSRPAPPFAPCGIYEILRGSSYRGDRAVSDPERERRESHDRAERVPSRAASYSEPPRTSMPYTYATPQGPSPYTRYSQHRPSLYTHYGHGPLRYTTSHSFLRSAHAASHPLDAYRLRGPVHWGYNSGRATPASDVYEEREPQPLANTRSRKRKVPVDFLSNSEEEDDEDDYEEVVIAPKSRRSANARPANARAPAKTRVPARQPASAPWYLAEYFSHSAYPTSSGVRPYQNDAQLVQARAQEAAYGYAIHPASPTPTVPWANIQTSMSSPTALAQAHTPTSPAPEHGVYQGHHYVPSINPITPSFPIIEQEIYTYTTQFSQRRYPDNWIPVTIPFHRAGMAVDGIPIGHLLNGGDADLIDANHRIQLPATAEDHIAETVTLCILIPGCERFTGRIHIVRRHTEAHQAGVITVADLACQIARHVDRFLKTPSGRAFAAREKNLHVSQIMLLDFHRVKKGTWQATLGKQTSRV